MLGEIHQQFIKVVRDGRGKRLKETPEMFSGLIWTGEKSIELGLADGLGSVDYVAREVIKAEKIVDYTVEENYFETLSKRLGHELRRVLRPRRSTRPLRAPALEAALGPHERRGQRADARRDRSRRARHSTAAAWGSW